MPSPYAIPGLPTHTDAAGTSRPGAFDRKSRVDSARVAEADAAARAAVAATDHQNLASGINPHLQGEHSPLEDLCRRALRRYGDLAPDTVDGETILMFLDFANEIVEDIRAHPYGDMPSLDYYVSTTDIRPIPDIIVIDGLLMRYALQQGSRKAEIYAPKYYRTLNLTLYNRKYGSGPIEHTPRDRNTDGSYGVPGGSRTMR